MGLYGRFKLGIGSKINKLLEKFEDPRETLDYNLEQMQDNLTKVKESIVLVATSRKTLEDQKRVLCESCAKYDEQARQAVILGRDDLATKALQSKKEAELNISGLTVQIKDIRTNQDKLEAKAKDFELNIERFRATKDVLKAQYTAAEANAKATKAVSGIGDDSGNVGNSIDRARQKTAGMTAEASALDELTESGVIQDFNGNRQDDIDRELNKIKGGKNVDAELQALKDSMGK